MAARDFKEMRESVESALREILRGGNSLIHEAMVHSVLSGGKRFRPLLMLSAGDHFGVAREEILPFACGIELIHNYSLVHDDLPCMDDDELRRGLPTCHKAFGEDVALLTGDALLTMAFEVMAGAPANLTHPQRRIKAIREISRHAGVEGMIGGQLLDIKYSAADYTEEDVYELMDKKTGGLILSSVTAGGILGGASLEEMTALREYGKNLGRAFQIRDDILDLDQDESEGDSTRPNLVHRIGQEQARIRLNALVEGAKGALRSASIDCDNLRILAERLLILKEQ